MGAQLRVGDSFQGYQDMGRLKKNDYEAFGEVDLKNKLPEKSFLRFNQVN